MHGTYTVINPEALQYTVYLGSGVSMAKKEKPDRDFAVGDTLKIKLYDGRIADAIVRAIVDDGEKLQVDYGHEETALVKASHSIAPPDC
jgi:hypothetical protein